MEPHIYCAKCREKTPIGEGNVRLFKDKGNICHLAQRCPNCDTKRNTIVSKSRVPRDVVEAPEMQQGGFFLQPIMSLIKSILG